MHHFRAQSTVLGFTKFVMTFPSGLPRGLRMPIAHLTPGFRTCEPDLAHDSAIHSGKT